MFTFLSFFGVGRDTVTVVMAMEGLRCKCGSSTMEGDKDWTYNKCSMLGKEIKWCYGADQFKGYYNLTLLLLSFPPAPSLHDTKIVIPSSAIPPGPAQPASTRQPSSLSKTAIRIPCGTCKWMVYKVDSKLPECNQVGRRNIHKERTWRELDSQRLEPQPKPSIHTPGTGQLSVHNPCLKCKLSRNLLIHFFFFFFFFFC